MPLRHDRFRALREAKGLSQEVLGRLAEVAHSTIAKIERGATPSADTLERLAVALDATMDYFYGRDFEDMDASTAAARMSFAVFAKDSKFNDQQRDRCRRVLPHPDAPKTAQAWRSFAEMIDLAIDPTVPTSSGRVALAVVREKRSKLKN